MKLRTKISLLTSGLGAALTVVGLVLVHRLFADFAGLAARSDLEMVRGTLVQLVHHSMQMYLSQATVVAEDTGLKEALLKKSPDLAFTYVDAARDRTRAEHIMLLDEDGRVLADLKGTREVGSAFPLPDLRGAPEGGARTGFLVLDGALVAAAIAPVKLQGRTLGALLLGNTVSPEMLGDVQRLADSAVTMITASGARISTLDAASAGAVVDYAAGCSAERMRDAARVEIAGTTHLVAVQALRDMRGEALGCIAVSRSLSTQVDELRSIQQLLGLLGLTMTAFAIAGGWFVASRIVKPIEGLTQTALRIAAGDLSQGELAGAGSDEVGQMALAVNQMLHSLRTLAEAASRIAGKDLTGRIELEGQVAEAFNHMIEGQRDVAGQMAAASAELTTASAQIYANMSEQERAASQQSAAVEEVSRTMQSLLDSASHIAESARGVLASAEGTKDTMDQVGRRIDELRGHTSRIAELLEVIRDIADRSDLLALNASLEATRAGESGRAFALLAGEMRRLAERVTASVQDVKSLLVDVRGSGVTSMDAVEEGRKLAESTTESARQITLVTQQQRTATEQVRESMQHISCVLSESLAAARETRGAAGVLKQEADKLAEVVGEFKLKPPDSP